MLAMGLIFYLESKKYILLLLCLEIFLRSRDMSKEQAHFKGRSLHQMMGLIIFLPIRIPEGKEPAVFINSISSSWNHTICLEMWLILLRRNANCLKNNFERKEKDKKQRCLLAPAVISPALMDPDLCFLTCVFRVKPYFPMLLF